MCYTVSALVYKILKYAQHRGGGPTDIKDLVKKLEQLGVSLPKQYVGDAFAHPKLIVFTNDQPYEPQAFTWGLIPFWTKTKADSYKIWNRTINARGETIFEKPSFRQSANNKRCLIYIDSFFEYHHHAGRAYPFNIAMKNGDPMALAGLWEEWVDKETGEILKTCSIVTTKANPLMARIHNNPKLKEARMPVILPKEIQDEWLSEIHNDAEKKEVQSLIRPCQEEALKVYTVGQLKGKEGAGNSEKALEAVEYEELAI